MKEKLIELLDEAIPSKCDVSLDDIANHLLTNGVIVKDEVRDKSKMSIVEKRYALNDFCAKRKSCDSCPLNTDQYKWRYPDLPFDCLNFFTSPESDLDKAMEICGIANTVQGE